MAIITDSIAGEIKRSLRGGATRAEIMNRFGVGYAVVRGIHTGVSWRHVQ